MKNSIMFLAVVFKNCFFFEENKKIHGNMFVPSIFFPLKKSQIKTISVLKNIKMVLIGIQKLLL